MQAVVVPTLASVLRKATKPESNDHRMHQLLNVSFFMLRVELHAVSL